MKQYIDKAAVVAEIERRMQELRPTNTHKMQVGEKMDRDVLMWLNALTWVKKVIDTLEVKEVDITSMADEYYDALIKEAEMDVDMAGHCRLAYYNGCKDMIKAQKGE